MRKWLSKIMAVVLVCSSVLSIVACGAKTDESGSVGDSSVSASSSAEEHEHVFSETWKNNSSAHWHACECGEKANLTKHAGEAESCMVKPVCGVCGREYGKAPGHAFGGGLTDIGEGIKGYLCKCGESVPLTTVEKEDGTTVQGLIDFAVEVEAGRDPVILQLSDTQLADSGNAEKQCYKYVRETVAATNPDLILVTGDLIYGKFDTNQGAIMKSYVSFMESLQIPWAPVYGNHDNECPMGVDWQCELMENAEYCLFEQGQVTGNGNYTVGVVQGDKLLRVFYMMDSNGCGAPSDASLGKVQTSVGFAEDQVVWFEKSIAAVKSAVPEVKLSFAYHIQQAYFVKAYEQYGYDGYLKEGSSSELRNPLNLDTMEGVKEGDFGYLGRTMKGPWDGTDRVFTKMKQLGVDSIFVGHEHCNSASVVYDGIRFQYGQKSSTYDRYNSLDSQGNIVGGYSNAGTPLIGGTAFSLSQEDGSIVSPYIYLCGDPLGLNPKNA